MLIKEKPRDREKWFRVAKVNDAQTRKSLHTCTHALHYITSHYITYVFTFLVVGTKYE